VQLVQSVAMLFEGMAMSAVVIAGVPKPENKYKPQCDLPFNI